MDYKIQTVHNAADDLPLCKEIVELTRPVRKLIPNTANGWRKNFSPALKTAAE